LSVLSDSFSVSSIDVGIDVSVDLAGSVSDSEDSPNSPRTQHGMRKKVEDPPPPNYIPHPPPKHTVDDPPPPRYIPKPPQIPSKKKEPPAPTYVPLPPDVSPLERYGIPPRRVAENSRANCRECKTAFGGTVHKFHCGCCGNLFCDPCTANKMVYPERYGYSHPERVCLRCLPKLLQLINSEDKKSPHQNKSENGTSSNDEISDEVYMLF